MRHKQKKWGGWLVWGWTFIIIGVPLLGIVGKVLGNGLTPLLKFWSQADTVLAFKTTFWLGFLAVVVNGIMGILLAWSFVHWQGAASKLIQSSLDLPFSVSPVVAGLMLIVFYGRNGLVGPWLESFGIKVIFAFPGMVLATLFVTLPFVVREILPVLLNFAIDQEESAKVLGASSWKIFWRITIPTIRWALFFGLSLTLARAIGEFGAVAIVSGSVAGKTQTATLRIHDLFTDFNYVEAFVGAILLALISFGTLQLMNSWLNGRQKREGRL